MLKSGKNVLLETAQKFASELVDGLNSSVTPFHAVEHCRTSLEKGGFKEISESQNWKLSRGGKYYFTRNNSTIIAFTIGKSFDHNKGCFKIVGAHTDSPNLRLAPNSYTESCGFEKFNIHLYGGGLWQTWFDRDLALAGKIIVRDETTNSLSTRLFRYDEPIFKIPNLAIHLTTERNKFEWNNETHLKAVLATVTKDESSTEKTSIEKKLGTTLSNLIASSLNVNKKNIIDYDLCLYDSQPACLSGIHKEFISSGRLDNLCTSVVLLKALIENSNHVENQSSINVMALFDNEETGSLSFQGADSSFFANSLNRIFNTIDSQDKIEIDAFDSFISRSFCVSADLAHAIHPNYSEKHQPQHQPKVHQGVTIKVNPQTRYATDSEGSAIIKAICEKGNILFQDFIVKQDSPCGTTIGPIISAKLGIKTADIGIPQWAMHSIRETCGVIDTYYYKSFFEEFYKSFEEIVGNLIQK